MNEENGKSTKRNNDWHKLVVICGFVLLVVALLIAHSKPATGYELDIYSSTPIFTWIFISLAMLCGAGIIIYQLVSKDFQVSRFWLLGLLILVVSHFSVLYIPYVRDYFTWSGDHMTHWGLTKDIVNTGHFDNGNYYPITHCILSAIILITNAPIQLVANLSTAFLSVFFIISTYLLSTVILPKKEQQLIATVIAAIVFIEGDYHVFLMPNGWSIFLLPLCFYFFFKNQADRSYLIPFVILLIMYPFFHPLSSLLIGVSLIVIYLIGLIAKIFLNRGNNLGIFAKPNSYLIFGIIELAILIPWVSSFTIFQESIKSMWKTLTSAGGEVLGQMTNNLSIMNIHGFNFWVLYFKLYGSDTILITFALIGIILIFLQIKKRDLKSFSFFIVDIGLCFLIFSLLYLLYLANMLGLRNIQAERIINYIMIFTLELAAIAIFWISQKLNNKSFKFVFIMAVLVIAAGLSLRGLYFSPYTLSANGQITVKDISGFEWMIAKKDYEIRIINISNPPVRFFDIVLGYKAATYGSDNYDVKFSNHFGYTKYNTLGEQYSENKYAVVSELDRVLYSTVLKPVGRFNDSDFIMLEKDNTVSKLYSNGGMDIFYIRSESSVLKIRQTVKNIGR